MNLEGAVIPGAWTGAAGWQRYLPTIEHSLCICAHNSHSSSLLSLVTL